MNKVYLITGSNIGDRAEMIESATKMLSHYGNILQVSSVYETEPWGFNDDTPFLNQVIYYETELSPYILIENILKIETLLGRTRHTEQFASRTIDIDILFYNDLIIDSPQLIIPHPRMADRKFVLIPLQEIAPNLVHPVYKISIQEMLNNCSDRMQVTIFRQ